MYFNKVLENKAKPYDSLLSLRSLHSRFANTMIKVSWSEGPKTGVKRNVMKNNHF